MDNINDRVLKSVTIDECTEGYNVKEGGKEGGTENVYAVTKDGLIRKVKELLGITHKKPKKKIIPEKTPEIEEEKPEESFSVPSKPETEEGKPEEPFSVPPEPEIPEIEEKPEESFSVPSPQDDLSTRNVVVHIEARAPKFSKLVPCEKFDISNLSAKKAGKSTYWLSEDETKICIVREGYAHGFHVYVTLDDLKYLYEHQDELKSVVNSKRYHITGFLKDVTAGFFEKKEKIESEELEQPEEPEPTTPDTPKLKLKFFQEDSGFDYMAVQPKQIGRTQVYANNGKMVIKVGREIVLTTQDMIETLLLYNEKELTASIRGINSEKQNILRVYLMEIKRRRTGESG